MKTDKKTWLLFLCGLVIGALLMGSIIGWTHLIRKAQATEADTGQKAKAVEAWSDEEADAEASAEESLAEVEAETVEEVEAEVEAEATQPAPGDTWDAEVVYNGGEEVAYGGKIYRAKWWTQGEAPGTSDVWEDTLVAAVQLEAVGEEEPEETAVVPRTDVAKREDFKVVGYFPSWKEDTGKLQYDVLTHINYAFAIPTSEGKLLPLENAAMAEKIIKKAHENGVKVFIAVGGWSYHDVPLESTFVAATETEEKRKSFAKEIVAMCDEYGFDGVDVDWEHPRVDGNSKKQYEALLVELADLLHVEGKQLSSAVLSGVTADGNVYYDSAAHTDTVLAAVDWINVMAYDGGDGERHSSYDFAVNCGTYWTQTRKMSPEKVILGVPFYARPSWSAYGDILTQVPDAWEKDHTDFNGMDAWYNGVATIEDKTAYALSNLGGIMIWEVSQDAAGEHSLQTAIGRTVKDK